MRQGIISCTPDTDMTTVAGTMATHHVHAVVVSGIEPMLGGGEHLTWGLVTALDLVAAATPGADAPPPARSPAPRSSPSTPTNRSSGPRS